MLREANLKVTKGEAQYSSDVEEGYVISCNPNVGTEVDEGSNVEIIVSLGAEPATVPDIRGKKEADAQAALEAAGLKGSASEEYSDDVPEGQVISQSIDPNSKVSKGTTVSYVVSRGPETKIVSVPDIRGMDEDTALRELDKYGLKGVYGGEEFSSTYGPGQICLINPSPGTRVTEGRTVTYYISLGPESSDNAEDGENNGS